MLALRVGLVEHREHQAHADAGRADAVEGQGRRAAEAVLVPHGQGPLQQDVRRGAQHDAAGSRRAAAAGRRRCRRATTGRRSCRRSGIGWRACARLPAGAAEPRARASGRHADDQPEGRAAQHRDRSVRARSGRPMRATFAIGEVQVNGDAPRHAAVGRGVVRAGAVLRHERRGEAREPVVQDLRRAASGWAMPERMRTGYAAAREVQVRAQVHRLAARSAAREPPTPAACSIVDVRAFNTWTLKGAIAKSELSFARRRKSALAPEEVGTRPGTVRHRPCERPKPVRRGQRHRHRARRAEAPRCADRRQPGAARIAAGRADVRDERLRRAS